MSQETWTQIVTIHNYVKALTLRAEELNPKGEFYFPSVVEERDAFEHVIRAKGVELGLWDPPAPSYGADSLGRALAHEYRAFFDIADWLAILYREKISAVVAAHSVDCLRDVIPEYYSDIRPELEAACQQIATVRSEKDIARDDSLAQVQSYWAILERLDGFWSRLASAESALHEHTAKERSEKRTGLVAQVMLGLVLTLVGAAAGWPLAKWSSPSEPPAPLSEPAEKR